MTDREKEMGVRGYTQRAKVTLKERAQIILRKNPVHNGRKDIIKHILYKKGRTDDEFVKLLWVSRIREIKLV